MVFLWIVFWVVLGFFLAPSVAYLVVKYGTVGFYLGRKSFINDERENANGQK